MWIKIDDEILDPEKVTNVVRNTVADKTTVYFVGGGESEFISDKGTVVWEWFCTQHEIMEL